MFSKVFWMDALERAISTAAQFVLLTMGLSEDAIGVIPTEINLSLLLWAAVGGFTLTIIKALAAAQLRSRDTASFAVNPPTPGQDTHGSGR